MGSAPTHVGAEITKVEPSGVWIADTPAADTPAPAAAEAPAAAWSPTRFPSGKGYPARPRTCSKIRLVSVSPTSG